MNSYLTGRRVFNGGSDAPTRGTVDPMGYIDRKFGLQSDRRSGLAKQALMRLQGGRVQQRPIGQPAPMGQPAPGQGAMGQPVGAPGTQGSAPGFATASSNSFSQLRPEASAPATPTFTYNPAGNMIYSPLSVAPGAQMPGSSGEQMPEGEQNITGINPGGPQRFDYGGVNREVIPQATAGDYDLTEIMDLLRANGGEGVQSIIDNLFKEDTSRYTNIGIGYDAQAANDTEDLVQAYNQNLLGLKQQADTNQLDYVDARRQTQDQIPDVLRDTLNRASGRGLAYSSGYADEVGEVNQGFSNMLNKLDSGHADILTRLLSGRVQADEVFNMGLGRVQREAARRLGVDAGTLGLIGDTGDTRRIGNRPNATPAGGSRTVGDNAATPADSSVVRTYGTSAGSKPGPRVGGVTSPDKSAARRAGTGTAGAGDKSEVVRRPLTSQSTAALRAAAKLALAKRNPDVTASKITASKGRAARPVRGKKRVSR